ncbi:MAG TPA: biopolymer transporter ExbD [Steroidobacteraceae bacterium]|jgi:biopolymer transport protein ExbD|nr:biopolymer transporter ExbD [Steroidobacteraceae bacterium]
MSMNLGSSEEDRGIMSEINTTPLVDIMLVLLIIFLITIPVITKTVKVQVPKAINIPTQTKPENITISITRDGEVFWGQSHVPTMAQLVDQIERQAVKVPQPEIHIRADAQTDYKNVGRVIAAINKGGLVKVGFITEPDRAMVPMR